MEGELEYGEAITRRLGDDSLTQLGWFCGRFAGGYKGGFWQFSRPIYCSLYSLTAHLLHPAFGVISRISQLLTFKTSRYSFCSKIHYV